MEVVGKQAPIPQSSAWATPLTFSSDPDPPRSHTPSAMQTNSNHHTSTSNAPTSFPSVTQVDLATSDPFRSSSHPHTTSHLVRSESAPINILEEAHLSRRSANLPDLSNLSLSGRRNSPLDSDLAHSSFAHPMNFAAAAASGVPSSTPASSAPSLAPPLINQGQRKPPQPTPASNKPPPSRSLSSVELANIVNGVGAPGVSAVPARIPPNPNANVVSASASNSASASSKKPATAAGDSSATGKTKKSSVPAWHKSVFDMIQDDFPRTPSPMFSSLLASRAGGATQDGVKNPEQRATTSDRRSRLASTASLDLDLDRLVASTDPPNEVKQSRPAEDEVPVPSDPQPPLRNHHRRSISINWTGDLSGLGTELSRSPSRTNLASSPPSSSFFPSKRPEIPPFSSPPSTVVAPAQVVTGSSLPAAIGASDSSSPPQSLSPTGSVQRTGVAMSSPQASPVIPLSSHSSAAVGPKLSQTHGGHYPLSNSGQEAIVTSVSDDLGVPGLSDYDYLYDQSETTMVPTSTPNPLSVFPNQGYSSSSQGYTSSHANLNVAQGLGSARGQPIGNGAQYANVFPGMGLFASPFSSNAAAPLGNGAGVAPVYNDSFRDGLAAADNLKNMSIQMAAFLSAQQQLYAAQMAQMAAITGTSGLSGNPGVFGTATIPGAHMTPVGNGSHLRSPWDTRDPSPPAHRTPARSKHSFDQYRGNGGHVGNQKKGSGIDVGHKGRGGRGRRGYRGHDDVGVVGGHKSDRVGLVGSLGGNMQDGSHARSPLLEEFRATSLSIGRGIGSVADVGIGGGFGTGGVGHTVHGGREWQLSEIKDNVVEFATDQHGSRFIQQKLESASVQDKEAILKHALTDAQRLMTDVFGNYVVQKLLDHGGENAVKLIAAELEGRMLVLSLHMYGCRVVQKALEVLESGARAALVRELDGHVLKCIRDQNGNHVIQKCVELVEPEAVQFIVDAVQGQAVVLAGHSYGCRVVQRILEHGASNQKAPIMVEIMSSIADLIKDQYGNYVIQHVVEHGTVEERAVIMNLVRGEVCQLSQHKFASNVVERCLQHGSLEERQVLIEILIVGEGAPNSSPLNHLVRDQFGNYVVQRVLDVARPPQRERVVSILKAQVPAIKKYSYGKHIIARLEEHQVGVSSNSYHHGQSSHSHGNGHSHALHRSDRHVGPTIMRSSVPQGIPRSQNEFMFYE